MGKKNFQAGQLIPTSSTPPPNAGFYRIDKNTIGVVGNLVQKNAHTNAESNLSSEKKIATVSRDLSISDSGAVIYCNSGSEIVITVMSDAVVRWLDITPIAIYQAGAGASSFAAGDGVTLRGTPPTPAQYATHAIMRVGANEWAYL